MPNPDPELTDPPTGRRWRTVAWTAAGSVVVVIAAIALTWGSGAPADRAASVGDQPAAVSSGEASAGPSDAATPAVGDSPAPAPAPTDADPVETSAPLVTPQPAQAPSAGEPGIEVLPLESEEETGLPASEALPDLLQDATPDSAKAQGRRVAGLPDVISPAPESTVTSSAVSVADETITANLAASTSAVGTEILAHYETALRSAGLSGTPATTSGGATVQTFYRGNDSVTVTIAATAAGVTAYTLRGLFTAQ